MRSPWQVWDRGEAGRGGGKGGGRQITVMGDKIAGTGREKRKGGEGEREKQSLLDNAVHMLIQSHHANGIQSWYFSFPADRELQPQCQWGYRRAGKVTCRSKSIFREQTGGSSRSLSRGLQRLGRERRRAQPDLGANSTQQQKQGMFSEWQKKQVTDPKG